MSHITYTVLVGT